MTTKRKSTIALWVFVVVLGSSDRLRAQMAAPTNEGQNAVVQSSSGSVVPTNSPAFVDASVYNNTDICAAIAGVLANWSFKNSNGVVIDARGVSSLNCSGNPWAGLSGSGFIDTVLLPAGTITISQTWIPISNTRIIGEGPNLTILQPGSGFPSNGDMIDMGGPKIGSVSPCVLNPGNNMQDCTGVVIEHLGINGGASSNFNVNGIGNSFSEELSYINDVSITNIKGIGLSLGVSCSGTSCSNTSSNSGPYSNISYTGTGACVSIVEKNPTTATNSLRGVHGLTCNTSNNIGIYLDGSNTTMDDITIIGGSSSEDGILIGSNTNGAARADALRNIRGGGTLGNLIHISSNAPQGGSPDVSDITILSVGQTPQASIAATIKDELTGTTLTDSTVGMYVLGEPVGTSAGYSRFTTSPNLPTWLVGTMPQAPSASCPTTATGSLYTCTTKSNNCGITTKTLWACVGGTWVGIE
jgi:hypothetical protein